MPLRPVKDRWQKVSSNSRLADSEINPESKGTGLRAGLLLDPGFGGGRPFPPVGLCI